MKRRKPYRVSVVTALAVLSILMMLPARTAFAQSSTAKSSTPQPGEGNRIAEARLLIASGRISSARRVLESLLSDSTDHVEARIRLLRIYQDTYLRNKERAQALSQAFGHSKTDEIRLDGVAVRSELRLRHLKLSTSPRRAMSFFDKRRAHAADDLLRADPDNALALLEKSLEARLLGHDGKAESLARQALKADPLFHTAYLSVFRFLSRRHAGVGMDSLARHMKHAMPENPYGWIMAGYDAFSKKDYKHADLNFQIARERMPQTLRRAYIDATPYLHKDVLKKLRLDSVSYSANYWIANDPLYLSGPNERLLEHFSRLAYADMVYSDIYADKFGWETDRGQFIVRYGVPDFIDSETHKETDDSRFEQRIVALEGDVTRRANNYVVSNPLEGAKTPDRFETWVYGDKDFRFYDTWWTDSFTLYSPSAAAFHRAASLNSAASLKDDQIEAHNWFYREPFRTAVRIPGARLPSTFVATRFRAESGTSRTSRVSGASEVDNAGETSSIAAPDQMMDVVVSRGIPVPRRPLRGALRWPIRVGAFLTSMRTGLAAQYREQFEELQASDMRDIDGTSFWTQVHTLHVRSSGPFRLSVEFQTLPTEAIYGVHRKTISPLESEDGSPAVSDLLLAYLIEESPQRDEPPDIGLRNSVLRRNGFDITPAPDSLFVRGAPLYVYFETYDLALDPAANSSLNIEAILVEAQHRKKGIAGMLSRLKWNDKKAAVSVTFEVTGHADTIPYYILLDTNGIEPGDYLLALRITDENSGKTTTTGRTVTIE